jgi:hypothetical protein
VSGEPTRKWWHPQTIAGAWTQARRQGDKEIRALTKFMAQAGVGAVLAWRLLVVLDGVLVRYQAGLERLTISIDRVGVILDGQTKALDEHLNEDLTEKVAIRVAEKLQPAPPKPKPVRSKPVELSR